MILNEFLYPHHLQRNTLEPELLEFAEELETFAQQVGYTCNLETGGKLSPINAYERLERLWEHLKQTKEELGIS